MVNNVKNKKKKKGFTLIELIIVIAIIAILAAIALPKFGEVRQNANVKSDIANAKNIQSAVVALIGEGKIANGATFSLSETTDPAAAVKSYLQTVPKPKASKAVGKEFEVVVSATGDVTINVDEKDKDNVQVYPVGEGTYAEATSSTSGDKKD